MVLVSIFYFHPSRETKRKYLIPYKHCSSTMQPHQGTESNRARSDQQFPESAAGRPVSSRPSSMSLQPLSSD